MNHKNYKELLVLALWRNGDWQDALTDAVAVPAQSGIYSLIDRSNQVLNFQVVYPQIQGCIVLPVAAETAALRGVKLRTLLEYLGKYRLQENKP